MRAPVCQLSVNAFAEFQGTDSAVSCHCCRALMVAATHPGTPSLTTRPTAAIPAGRPPSRKPGTPALLLVAPPPQRQTLVIDKPSAHLRHRQHSSVGNKEQTTGARAGSPPDNRITLSVWLARCSLARFVSHRSARSRSWGRAGPLLVFAFPPDWDVDTRNRLWGRPLRRRFSLLVILESGGRDVTLAVLCVLRRRCSETCSGAASEWSGAVWRSTVGADCWAETETLFVDALGWCL